LIKASDFLILPSIKGEGLPKVVIEAMVQEIVPIASKVGGCPELIEHGVSGIITKPKSSDDIASAIRQVFNNNESAVDMGQKARKRIKELFHVGVGVSAMENAYNAILQQ
jgi:glycosyltransferase involved in cell wall biosynthesis